MTLEQKEAKDRIMLAAAKVFANKGYGAAGIREIAQEANVNISMISYYFGGKEGVLKEIVNTTFRRYNEMLQECLDVEKDLETNIRCIAHGLIRFFRNHTEEAIVAFDVMPLTIPETIDLMTKWKLELLKDLAPIFGRAGFGLHDPAAFGLAASTMPVLVLTQFQGMYVLQATGKMGEVQQDYGMQFDDAYFDDYAEKMADFIMGGIERLMARQAQDRKGGGE
jgi:AcrR family transcriptional regulator